MGELSAHDNDRSLERHIIHCDVDVYDSLRDIYLGRLVNIHVKGLMIVGDIALEEDKLYEIDMHMPADNQVLRLGVDCLWMRPADLDGKYWTGFNIIEASPVASEEIRKLIALWCHG
jgi:hypothetical protein